jgi:Lrp/AsnC family transcriptional regulator for asnA, asnC and gidA
MRLDPLDHAIIAQLQDDATISLRTLAARCGSSEPTVRRRVARLRKQDVMRVVAVVDPFKQGYPVVAIINLQVDQRQMDTVKVALAGMKELRFVGVTVGTYDLVAEAWFHSTDEMLTFMSDMLARVPGIIRATPLQVLQMVKYAYDWGQQRAAEPPRPGAARPRRVRTR